MRSAALIFSTLLALNLTNEAARSEPVAHGATEAYLGIGVVPVPPSLYGQLPDILSIGQGVLVDQVKRIRQPTSRDCVRMTSF